MESSKEFIKRKMKEFETKKSSNKKKDLVPMKDISREGKHYYRREAWTFMPQHNLNKKVFLIERLKKELIEGEVAYAEASENGVIEYRFGYFIVGKNGNKKDKWVWGQFCPIFPPSDLKELLDKAKNEGTLLV